MSAIDIMKIFVLPVIYENNDPTYKYTFTGSGIRVVHNNQHFFVVTKHQVRNENKYSPNQLCVPSADWSCFIPLSSENFVAGMDEAEDIAVYKIEQSLSCNAGIKSDFFELNSLSSDNKLFMYGYPSKEFLPEYEKNHYNIKIVEKSAHYSCEVNDFKSRIYVDLDENYDFDGFSGGAVMLIEPNQIKFVGMITNANSEGLVEFYRADKIKMILEALVKGRGFL